MKKQILICCLLILGTSCTLLSSAGLSDKGLPTKEVPGELTSTTANSVVNIDHSTWTELLQKHVSENGLVDYEGFLKDREKLNNYLTMLSKNKPTKKWSVQEQLAYYINTYNAYTVDLILEHYPVKSIKDIDGAWTNAIVPIGNVEMSLGGIENSILRKMNEPRIHFAINCASMSCPKLLNEAFTAAKINEQLEKVTREFIRSDKNNISANTLKLSHIFKWYKTDFTQGENTLIDYIEPYVETDIQPNAEISYLPYDWSLNAVN